MPAQQLQLDVSCQPHPVQDCGTAHLERPGNAEGLHLQKAHVQKLLGAPKLKI